MDYLGFLIFSISLALLVVLSVDSYRHRRVNKKLKATITQLVADRNLVLDRVERLENNKAITQKEEFVNFLTKSRDDAYQYIEAVHKAVENFTVQVEPYVKTNNELLAIVNKMYDEIMPQNPDT